MANLVLRRKLQVRLPPARVELLRTIAPLFALLALGAPEVADQTLLGEAMLANLYAYKAGVNLILCAP